MVTQGQNGVLSSDKNEAIYLPDPMSGQKEVNVWVGG